MTSIKQQALRGGFWIGVERFGQQGVQFVVSIILARLLEPSEFGLVAMISIFWAFSAALINGGFASALIQKKNVTRVDESTVFWFNFAISILMVAILWFGAPLIARFYNRPILTEIARWSSLNLFFTGFAVVQLALLSKNFMFRTRMIASLSGVFLSGIVSIWMAFKGFGVWALVAQGLVMNCTMVLLIWVLHPWRPLFVFSTDSFKSLFGFGSRLLGVGLMNAIFQNLYQLIIGKIYSASELGFFQRAKRFVMLFSHTPISMITQVHFPYLCKIQSNPDQIRNVFSKSLKYSTMLTMPLLMGLMVVAPNIIIFLVGEKWMPSVPYIRIMAFTGVLFVVYMLNLDVIKARGDSGVILKYELFNRSLLAVSIVVLYRYGISALLYGELLCTLISTGLVIRSMHKYIRAGIMIQLKWISPCLLATVAMALVAHGSDIHSLNLFSRLVVQISSGTFAYVAVLLLLRDKELLELVSAILIRLRKVK